MLICRSTHRVRVVLTKILHLTWLKWCEYLSSLHHRAKISIRQFTFYYSRACSPIRLRVPFSVRVWLAQSSWRTIQYGCSGCHTSTWATMSPTIDQRISIRSTIAVFWKECSPIWKNSLQGKNHNQSCICTPWSACYSEWVHHHIIILSWLSQRMVSGVLNRPCSFSIVLFLVNLVNKFYFYSCIFLRIVFGCWQIMLNKFGSNSSILKIDISSNTQSK